VFVASSTSAVAPGSVAVVGCSQVEVLDSAVVRGYLAVGENLLLRSHSDVVGVHQAVLHLLHWPLLPVNFLHLIASDLMPTPL